MFEKSEETLKVIGIQKRTFKYQGILSSQKLLSIKSEVVCESL